MESFGALFDPTWYLKRYPDVAEAGFDPLVHYRKYGIVERRDPNPLFDTNWYLAQNPDVARASLDPLAHYLLWGAAEGRNPHPLFDSNWYLAQDTDLAKTGINPLAHFLTEGAPEGRIPHPSFEADWSFEQDIDSEPFAREPSPAGPAPLVSVIVPVFNNAPYLRECLSSILNQSLRDIEVICIEDGSTDESATILADVARSDPRVLVATNISNLGASKARNIGIHWATGKFIQFTDADDILPSDALESLYELAHADQVPLVRGTLRSCNSTLDDRNEYYQICPDKRKTRLADEPALWVPWWHTTYLISVPLLREIGGRYPSLKNGEDPVFITTLLVAAEVISTTSRTTYLRRVTETRRRTRLVDTIDFVRHTAMVRRSYLDHCPQAWREGYRPFLLGKLEQFFLKPDLFVDVERDVIRLAMIRAGIGAYLPLDMRPLWPSV